MQLDKAWLQSQGADAPLLAAVDAALLPLSSIAVAVSGGSDSTALLVLTAQIARQTGKKVLAVTVDHGLRADSASEASAVAALCVQLELPHTTLRWSGWNGQGNLPAAARDARYRLMAEWARSAGAGCVLIGHTADDQAENVLIRLARKSGVDGLSSMDARFDRDGMIWVRPLLRCARSELRACLTRRGIVWADDPTNDDESYDRPRARQILRALAPLGIDAETLGDVSRSMRSARDALAHYTRPEARRFVTADRGDLILADLATAGVPEEVCRRLWVAAVQWISGQSYPPRADAMDLVRRTVAQSGKATLGGCLITKDGDTSRFSREYNALRDQTCVTTGLWDGRWHLDGPHAPDLHIAALGEAISECPNWRDVGLPRSSLVATPAIWRGESLISAPLAGFNRDWTARIVADFDSFLHSH